MGRQIEESYPVRSLILLAVDVNKAMMLSGDMLIIVQAIAQPK
jgi:hypothetical protein